MRGDSRLLLGQRDDCSVHWSRGACVLIRPVLWPGRGWVTATGRLPVSSLPLQSLFSQPLLGLLA